MLQRSVRVEEASSDGSDLGSQRVGHHLVEPARPDHLGVVVEETDELALGPLDGLVVDRREVEGLVVPEDPRARAFELGEVGERSRVAALVVDEDELVVPVGRLRADALDAASEERLAVACRDDDGDEGSRLRDRIPDVVGARESSRLDRESEVLGDGLARLRGDASPRVREDERNVPDPRGVHAGRAAEREGVVRALPATGTANGLAVESGEPPHVVGRVEEIQVPVGLEVGLRPWARLRECVLVGIEKDEVGSSRAFEREHGECVGRELAGPVEEDDELPSCLRERRLGVLLDEDFMVRVELLAYRLDRSLDPARRDVLSFTDDDGEVGRPLEARDGVRDRLPVRGVERVEGLDPLSVAAVDSEAGFEPAASVFLDLRACPAGESRRALPHEDREHASCEHRRAVAVASGPAEPVEEESARRGPPSHGAVLARRPPSHGAASR